MSATDSSQMKPKISRPSRSVGHVGGFSGYSFRLMFVGSIIGGNVSFDHAACPGESVVKPTRKYEKLRAKKRFHLRFEVLSIAL
jgi:hypothetical protein